MTIATSLTPATASPRELLALLRGYWMIENRVHRVRYIIYSRDLYHCRTRHKFARMRASIDRGSS